MRRTTPDRRVAVFAAAVLGLALVVAAVGSRAAPGGSAADARGPARPPAGATGPVRWTGPQGFVGQFVVHCTYSHSGRADPIVFPGAPGRSHRHDFYGAVNADAASTPATLARARTTCDKEFDTAAYWHPTLLDHGRPVEPTGIAAYYRAAPGVAPRVVAPYPLGLALIAGDHAARGPQPGEAAGWTCGSATWLSDTPRECMPTAPLTMVLTFPDCWDGEHLDSVDHRSHVAYSQDGRCPPSRPVHVPQLTVAVSFPVSGTGHALTLSSGPTFGAHGDFLNAWDPAGLAREVEHCIHRAVVCELASNRAEEPLFQHT